MTDPDRWALAVDFGTSRTTGAMASGGTITALEVDANRWIASMVLLAPDGTVLVGTAAENQAGVHPDRVERTPKRRVGTGVPLLLGGDQLEVVDAIAALLARFADEGRLRRNGRDPDAVVLTHPVRWEEARCDVLRAAAKAAGLPDPVLVEEPVAAAIHYVGDQVEVGQYVGVYDLGGGTFDTAILQRTETGFESVGAPGGDEHIGGEDFDHLLFRHFGALVADEATEVWDAMLTSDERRWQRAAADLLTQSRRAKEALSSFPQTQVFVPDADRDFMVTRAEFEAMIHDAVERTVDEMEDTVASAGLRNDDLAALYLVGGSSRIPLVVAQLTERFGTKVATRDEPKSVVALGAAILASRELAARTPEPAAAAALVDAAPAVPAVDDAAVRWRMPLPALATAYVGSAGRFLAVDQGLEVVAWSATDGSEQWRAPLGGHPAGPPAGHGDAVYAIRTDGYVGAFAAETGLARWWALAPSRANGALAANDAVVAVVGDDGSVAGLDAGDGALLWHFGVDMPAGVGPALTATSLVIGGTDGRVGGLEPVSGQARWWYPTGGALTGLAAEDDVVLAIANGLLFALEPDTGEARFAFRADAAVLSAAVTGDCIVVLSADQVLTGLGRTDGLERWRAPLGTTGAIGPVVTDAHVAIAEYDVRVYDVATGTLDATMPVAPGWYPAATGNVLAFTGVDGALIAIHPGS